LLFFVMNEAQHAAQFAYMLAMCAGIVPNAFWPKRYDDVEVMVKSSVASGVCFICLLAPLLQIGVAIVVLIAASILLTKKQAIGDAILSAVALTWVLDVDNKVGEICAWPGRHFAAANTDRIRSDRPRVSWGFKLLQLLFATAILFLALLAQWSVAHIYHAYDWELGAVVMSLYDVAARTKLSDQIWAHARQYRLHTRVYLLGYISPACVLIALFHRHPMFTIKREAYMRRRRLFSVAGPLAWAVAMLGNVAVAWQFDAFGKRGYVYALLVASGQAAALLCLSFVFEGIGQVHNREARFTAGRFQVRTLVPSPVAAGHHPCAQAQC
jgi:hypothetical protein